MDEIVRARYAFVSERLVELDRLLAGHLSSMRFDEYLRERNVLREEHDALVEEYPELVVPPADVSEPESVEEEPLEEGDSGTQPS